MSSSKPKVPEEALELLWEIFAAVTEREVSERDMEELREKWEEGVKEILGE
jgi:hypothetical protein